MVDTLIPVHFFKISRKPLFEWRDQGNCLGIPIDEFFPERGGRKRKVTEEICEGCPVKLQCTVHAIVHDEHGIWGGTTRNERSKIPVEVVEYLKKTPA